MQIYKTLTQPYPISELDKLGLGWAQPKLHPTLPQDAQEEEIRKREKDGIRRYGSVGPQDE